MSDALKNIRARLTSVSTLLVLLIAVALSVLPRDAAPVTALIAAGAFPAIIAVHGWRRSSEVARTDALIIVAAGVPAVLLLLGSLAAQNPRVSFVGMVGQHSGSLAWFSAYLIFVASYLTARPRDLGGTLRSLSVLGALLSVAAGLEALGVVPGSAYSAPPSGILENPGSLGQILVLTTLCAMGWIVAIPTERWVAAPAAVLGVMGMGVAASEGAWAGLAAGAASGLVIWALMKRRRLRPTLVAISSGLAIVAVGLAVASIGISYGSGDTAGLAGLTHDRASIWASAVKQVAQAPVVGSGAEQFSAWVRWTSDPGLTLDHVGTYDPHNLVLWWALALGWPGAMMLVSVAVLLVWRLADALTDHRSVAVAAVLAALTGFGASLMLTWANPLALATGALLCGTAIGAVRGGSIAQPQRGRAILVVAAVLGLVVTIATISGGAVAEYRWADAVRSGEATGQLQLELAQATSDPFYWASAAEHVLSATDPLDATTASRLDRELRPDAVWHVDAAFQRLAVEMARGAAAGETDLESIDVAVADARVADPASALWDYTGAVYLKSMGEHDASAEYAARALDLPLDPGVREYLRGLVLDAR